MPSDIREYSLWLMPQAEDGVRLDERIRELAPQFGIAPFQAHVTLQGDLALPLAELCEIAFALALAQPAFVLPVTALASSAHYFRSLYLALDEGSVFPALQGICARLTDTAAGLSPFPHISLAYGEPVDGSPKDSLQRIHAAKMGAPSSVRIGSLAVALSSCNVPIAEWRVLRRFALGAPRSSG